MENYVENILTQASLVTSTMNKVVQNENSNSSDTLPELQTENITSATKLESLPLSSRSVYEKQYAVFMKWCEDNNIKNFTESSFMAYFSLKAANRKSSTLWSTYSMLKSTIATKNNIDISKYGKLIKFLKEQSIGYKPKKSKFFNRIEIKDFLLNAPNDPYLMWKVCLIIGTAGACSRDELRKLRVEDIIDIGNLLLITIPDPKNGKKRVFTLSDETYEGTHSLDLIRKYRSLRPDHCQHNIFFVNYRLNKCSTQVVGVNTLSKIPSFVAKYLNLPDEHAYTGHCYRRTSMSLSKNSGVDVLALNKRHKDWNSSGKGESNGEDFKSNFIVDNSQLYDTKMLDIDMVIKSENVEDESFVVSTSKSDMRGTSINLFDVSMEDQEDEIDYLDRNEDDERHKMSIPERLTDPLQNQEQFDETDQFCRYLATQLKKVVEKERSKLQLQFLQQLHNVLHEEEYV